MNRDEEIRQGLRMAGVPEGVFKKTLITEDAKPLREMITGGTLVRDGATTGIFLHPAKRSDSARARTVFYLTAKEMFLSGTTVYCIPVIRLLEAMSAVDHSHETMMLERVRMVFVTDFYEEGAPFPFSAADAGRLRLWVRSRFEEGKGVSFLSDTGMAKAGAWWSEGFLGFIGGSTVAHSV